MITKQAPLVSVIIPTYNYGKYLEKCIESVVQQKFDGSMEIIVVDDGSEDNTEEVVSRYPAKYLRLEHKGVSHARNIGLAESKGEWIAFIDADDRWTEDKLFLQLEKAKQNKNAEIIFSPVENVYIDEKVTRTLSSDYSHYLIPALIKRELLIKYGPFPEKLKRGEDTYILLLMQMEKVDLTIAIDKACYIRQVHSDSITFSAEASMKEIMTAAMLEHIKRKREDGS